MFRTQEGSSNDQVGIASEVASVIRKFTEPVIEDEDIYSEKKLTSDFVSCSFFFFLWHSTSISSPD